jgi:Holliday junction resolvasome RuvABC DNA-binding subunit
MELLPRYNEAVVPEDKLLKYSLALKIQPDKALVFREALGYTEDNAQLLIDNIKRNLKNFPAQSKGDKGYGETYAVLMKLTGANKKTANVMTAWLDDKKTGVMRLTSVYVKKRKG